MKTTLIYLVFISFSLFSQSKYFVFFEDKPAGYSDWYDAPINQDYINYLLDNKIEIANILKWFNAVSCYLNDNQKEMLETQSFVSKVEKVRKLKTAINVIAPYSVFDVDYGNSFSQLNLSDIPRIHNLGITGKGVRVGLLDTGFDWKKHEALKNSKVVAEYDFVFGDSITSNESNDHSDQHNHGTYVFSIIGGYSPNNLIGSAFNAEFVLAKTEDIRSEKHVEEDNYAAALEWMYSLGVQITSSSLGYNTFDSPEPSYTYQDMDGKTTICTRAAEIAYSKGMLVITSAGNEGNMPWRYITAPADGFKVISIGAVNRDNNVASFSSRGPTADGRIKPDLVAMGVSVFGAKASTINQYSYSNGTSASAPIASGVAALLLSAHPYLNNNELRDILIKSGDNYTTPDNNRGYGLISADRAISYPVVKNISDTLKLIKYFFDDLRDSLKLIVKSGNELFTFYPKTTEPYKYEANLNKIVNISSFYYYFNFIDSSNNVRTVPDKNFVYFYNGKTSLVNLKQYDSNDINLSQNYPNPFNPEIEATIMEIYAGKQGYATLNVFNILGEKVRTLFSGNLDGLYSFSWDGRNCNGKQLPAGVYFYSLSINGSVRSKKAIILR